MDLNTITIVGRLTANPELKTSQAGNSYVRFGLAVSHGKDDTSFINCTAFGKTSENISKYVSKGHRLGISGYLKQNRWQTNSGDNRSEVIINVNQISFLQPNTDNNNAGQANPNGNATQPPPPTPDVEDESIPF